MSQALPAVPCCAEMSGCVSQEICDIGYSPHDIITTFFRVVKLSPELPEFLKLEFIRVSTPVLLRCQGLPMAHPAPASW